jgi:hypothetical protein
MSVLAQLFTMRAPRADGKTEFICCISMEDSFDGPERVEFPAAQALCIYFRGPYEELGTAMQSLAEYVQEHNIETTGPFRSIFMERFSPMTAIPIMPMSAFFIKCSPFCRKAVDC